jgi:hypothetical protein
VAAGQREAAVGLTDLRIGTTGVRNEKDFRYSVAGIDCINSHG